jgi:hypothetical protein
VPVDTVITAQFSEPLAPARLDHGTFRVALDGEAVDGMLVVEDCEVTFTPSAPLEPGRMYAVSLGQELSDEAGNRLGQQESWTFRTRSAATAVEQHPAPGLPSSDVVPPEVSKTVPPDGDADAPLDAITMVFSEPLALSSARSGALVVQAVDSAGGFGEPLSGRIELGGEGRQLKWMPELPLPLGTRLRVRVGHTLRDRAGNALPDPYEWSFTTRDGRWAAVPDPIPAAHGRNVRDLSLGLDRSGAAMVAWVDVLGSERSTLWGQRAASAQRWRDAPSASRVDRADRGQIYLRAQSLAVNTDGAALLAWAWYADPVTHWRQGEFDARTFDPREGWSSDIVRLTADPDGSAGSDIEVYAGGYVAAALRGDVGAVAWSKLDEWDRPPTQMNDVLMVRELEWHHDAFAWGPSKQVSARVPPPATTDARQPRLALHENGGSVAVWEQAAWEDSTIPHLPPEISYWSAGLDRLAPIEIAAPDQIERICDLALDDGGNTLVLAVARGRSPAGHPTESLIAIMRDADSSSGDGTWQVRRPFAGAGQPTLTAPEAVVAARAAYLAPERPLIAWTLRSATPDGSPRMHVVAGVWDADQSPVLILGDGTRLGSLRVLGDGIGNGLVLWGEHSEGEPGYRIWAARYRRGFGWMPSRAIYELTKPRVFDGLLPDMRAAISSSGRAIVVWRETELGKGDEPLVEKSELMTLRFQ